MDVPEAPWFTPSALGEAKRRKLGACTASETFVVEVRSPEVPVMVRLVVDVGAVALAVRVNTLLPAVGLVPHAAVTPLGNVEVTARLTLPVNPPASVTVTVLELEPP